MHACKPYGLTRPIANCSVCRVYKSFKLTWLHLVSACLFTLGYALREYGAFNYLYNPDDETALILFVLSQVFIYVCP